MDRKVELIGTKQSNHGFHIRGTSQVEIAGFAIRNFPGNGIWIDSSHHISIHHCYVGLDRSGDDLHPNGKSALRITDSTHISLQHNILYASTRRAISTELTLYVNVPNEAPLLLGYGLHGGNVWSKYKQLVHQPAAKWDLINNLTVWDSSDIIIRDTVFGTNRHQRWARL